MSRSLQGQGRHYRSKQAHLTDLNLATDSAVTPLILVIETARFRSDAEPT